MLPASERPSLIMAYFDQPDNVGHFHTTDQQVILKILVRRKYVYQFYMIFHAISGQSRIGLS